MDKYPEHDQKFFFKYFEIDTAKKIIESQKFRYSSPLTFNDPFDIQTELYFDFDVDDLPQAITNELHEIVIGNRKVDLSGDSDWVKGTKLFQEKHKEGVYRKGHLEFIVKPLIGVLTEIFEDTRKQYNEHWKGLLKRLKIFCVSETNSSILMWSHYAKNHTGVCFKLNVLPDIDNTLCAAKKVNYMHRPPTFFSVEEWIDSVVIDKPLDFDSLFYQYPLAKSDIWKYEKEWRVWAPHEETNSLYLDVPAVKGEINAIYFGAEADIKEIDQLVTIASNYGINNFFRAVKQEKHYGVKFEKL